MFEVFKRVVNEEISEADEKIVNYKNPAIRAQSIFLLAKHWKPFDASNSKTVKTEEDGMIKIN
jgi:hypothetical protein